MEVLAGAILIFILFCSPSTWLAHAGVCQICHSPLIWLTLFTCLRSYPTEPACPSQSLLQTALDHPHRQQLVLVYISVFSKNPQSWHKWPLPLAHVAAFSEQPQVWHNWWLSQLKSEVLPNRPIWHSDDWPQFASWFKPSGPKPCVSSSHPWPTLESQPP